MPVISGPVKWASIQSPNTKFEPQWCVDVVLDLETAKKLRAEGFNVKKDKDGDLILKCSRKTTKKGNVPNSPPRVVDGNKETFTELVGNGSICNVQYVEFPWEMLGRKGKKAILQSVQVVTHVPFVKDEFEVVGGGQDTPEDDVPVVADSSDIDDFDDDIPF